MSNSLQPLWTLACCAPLFMRFFRQECWSRLPFPAPGILPNPGVEPGCPVLLAESVPAEPSGKPNIIVSWLQTMLGRTPVVPRSLAGIVMAGGMWLWWMKGQVFPMSTENTWNYLIETAKETSRSRKEDNQLLGWTNNEGQQGDVQVTAGPPNRWCWRPEAQTLVFLTLFGDLGLTALLWEWGRSASTYKSSCKQIVYCTLTHTLQRKVTNKHNKMLTCISWALAFWEILYKPFSTFSGFLHDP